MKKLLTTTLLLGAALALNGCCGAPPKVALLDGKPLPASYASPDGMTLGKDGYIYVSINQVASGWKHPAKIARISPDDKIEDFFELPKHAKTGKTSPLGIAFDPDGNLYVSDNQAFVTDVPNLAGLLRVNIKDGKPLGADLVATGFNMSNGMAIRDGHLYVAETNLGAKDKFLSGVYRFSLADLKSGAPIKVTGLGDPRLILTFETKNPAQKVGANGVDFDSKGVLYVNNFGDAQVHKFTLDPKGNALPVGIIKAEGAKSVDGLHIDSADNLWIADFLGNRVVKICPGGKTTIVAQNTIPSTGANGSFDSPSECIRRGDKVYVSNIDLTNGPHTADEIQTISVITLK